MSGASSTIETLRIGRQCRANWTQADMTKVRWRADQTRKIFARVSMRNISLEQSQHSSL
jgi:hypothetical protein